MGNMLCCLDSPGSKHSNPDLVPATPTITAEWLTEALRREGRLTPTQRVSSLSMAPVTASCSDGTAAANGGGLAGGAVVRITDITYDGIEAESTAQALPRVLIHKWCSASDILKTYTLKERAFFGFLFHLQSYYGVRQELSVYRDLADELKQAGVKTPTIYYCALDDGAVGTDRSLCCAICCPHRAYTRSSVLCEDMGERGLTAGMATSGPRMSHQNALAAVITLARIHAWGWGGRGRGEPESKWTALLAGHGRMTHGALKKFQTDATLQKFLDMWSSRDHAVDLRDEGLRQMLWDLRANFGNWFQRGCAMQRDQTLLHGDYHLGNIFVKQQGTSPDDVTLIDWAYLGTGHVSWEINYFLTLSCDGSHGENMALLAAYHSELVARNPSIRYTLDECKEDCKLTLFTHVIVRIRVLGSRHTLPQ